MSRLLIRSNPRSLSLTTETHALTFHAYHTSPPRISLSFSPLSTARLNLYRPASAREYVGVLGLIQISGDIFLVVISSSREVARIRPREPVYRIERVEFWCLTRHGLDFVGDEGEGIGLTEDGSEHMCVSLRRVLSQGTFYYAKDCDLTRRLQDRGESEGAFEGGGIAGEEGFLWTDFLVKPLRDFRESLSPLDRKALESQQLIVGAIRGFVESARIGKVMLTLISRLGCRRAGTRFNSRGMDDDGNVANFVETEVVIWDELGESTTFSYCQIRGSVPIFWEQAAGVLPNQQKIQITRSPEATQPAFDRHFETLTVKYGPTHIVNLLSATKPGEVDLTLRYRYHAKNSRLNSESGGGEKPYQEVDGALAKKSSLGAGHGALIRATEYDFHAETAGRYEAANGITYLLEDSAESFGFFLSEGSSGVVLQQEGIFRTNCLDCLDRTNLVQGIISQMSIEQFLRQREQSAGLEFWNVHSRLWADNGDALSKIYAGTGALKSSYTRTGKSSLAGLFADVGKSVVRTYVNNFVDKGRQEVTDTLLGRLMGQTMVALYDPLQNYVSKELSARAAEFTHITPIHVHVCTVNLNGRMTGLGHDLSPILFPAQDGRPADIIAVGFQEIVELSPQQIMATDPVRRQEWEKVVTKTLNVSQRSPKDRKYVLLRSSQLVGCAMLLFVADIHLSKVKNVEGAMKKTGMSGMAGNKGAVAVRLDFSATSMCFVTAHLAAGLTNVDERNRDYRTIAHGLTFIRGRKIQDHDFILWAGDFNYRINLPNESCRAYVAEGNLAALLEQDQLRASKSVGEAFDGFIEPRIEFMPTYRFNLGTDEYDTSEKMRIPAWTDRVLYRNQRVKAKCTRYYAVFEARFSDHKPVVAELDVGVKVIDEAKREEVERQARRAARQKLKDDEQSDLLTLDDEECSNRSSPLKPSSPSGWDTWEHTPLHHPSSTNSNPPAPPPPRRTGTNMSIASTSPGISTTTIPLRRVPPPFPYPGFTQNPNSSSASIQSVPILPSNNGNGVPPPLPKRTPTDLLTNDSVSPTSLQSKLLHPAPPRKPDSLSSNLPRSPSAPQLSSPPQHMQKKPPIPRKPVALTTTTETPAGKHAPPTPPKKPLLSSPPASHPQPIPSSDSGVLSNLVDLQISPKDAKKTPPVPPPPRRGATLLDEEESGLGGSWEVLVPAKK